MTEAPHSTQRYVRLHLYGVPAARIPGVLARFGTQRFTLRRRPHLTFAKLLGTARPTSFTPRDTDPRHWGLLTVWDDADAAERFDADPVARSWQLVADQTLRLSMTPLSSTGMWARTRPFGDPAPRRTQGPVAAITRARIRPGRTAEFWRTSKQVAQALGAADGLLLASGIGEAPLVLQGTFSLWRDSAAMNAFAHRDATHLDAVTRTPTEDWYAEELFARFSVTRAVGTFAGTDFDLHGAVS